MDDGIEEFKTYLELEGKSPQTVRMYTYYVERFLKDVKNPNYRSALRFLAKLKKEGYSNKSLNLVVQALKSYFRFEGLDEDAEKLKSPKVPRSLPKSLTREDVKRLLNALRVSEVCNLKIKDIDFNRGVLTVKGGKGAKDRIVPLSGSLLKEIDEYLETRKDGSEYLFVEIRREKKDKISPKTVWYLLKKYGNKANVTHAGERN